MEVQGEGAAVLDRTDAGNELEAGNELDQLMLKARMASDFLKALSHESRLLVLCLLAEKERTVSDLETLLALRQPTVSQQLARLRADGMVSARRDGKAIYYSLANENVRQLIATLQTIFCPAPADCPQKGMVLP